LLTPFVGFLVFASVAGLGPGWVSGLALLMTGLLALKGGFVAIPLLLLVAARFTNPKGAAWIAALGFAVAGLASTWGATAPWQALTTALGPAPAFDRGALPAMAPIDIINVLRDVPSGAWDRVPEIVTNLGNFVVGGTGVGFFLLLSWCVAGVVMARSAALQKPLLRRAAGFAAGYLPWGVVAFVSASSPSLILLALASGVAGVFITFGGSRDVGMVAVPDGRSMTQRAVHSAPRTPEGVAKAAPRASAGLAEALSRRSREAPLRRGAATRAKADAAHAGQARTAEESHVAPATELAHGAREAQEAEAEQARIAEIQAEVARMSEQLRAAEERLRVAKADHATRLAAMDAEEARLAELAADEAHATAQLRDAVAAAAVRTAEINAERQRAEEAAAQAHQLEAELRAARAVEESRQAAIMAERERLAETADQARRAEEELQTARAAAEARLADLAAERRRVAEAAEQTRLLQEEVHAARAVEEARLADISAERQRLAEVAEQIREADEALRAARAAEAKESARRRRAAEKAQKAAATRAAKATGSSLARGTASAAFVEPAPVAARPQPARFEIVSRGAAPARNKAP
jgi:hypothetical protein